MALMEWRCNYQAFGRGIQPAITNSPTHLNLLYYSNERHTLLSFVNSAICGIPPSWIVADSALEYVKDMCIRCIYLLIDPV